MFDNTIHGKNRLIELTKIVLENERSRILIKFTRFLVKFRLIEGLNSSYFKQNSSRLVISTRILVDFEIGYFNQNSDRFNQKSG